ncbi:TPA: hypothetical protein ACN331_002445 [Vibrio parahaemolyticus]|uniref:hypothetical protein n=1 Tax=Vibrio parahaemolyticus TaxID=670 RepID=UPI001110CDD3|nr:hypothetical protein [Vibrio parahaemolyticus]MBE4385059.1 hypothetical protein [Vibrio parahaemolyticus]MEA5230177.1 hypothetical protein [Vibrio parahaemolyticus]NYU23831.1 hypothetical protein [Vibrio parahaemolyticus]TMX39424.1 hypothetical protein DA098_09045 [Vibrio parahaemolyticus]TMX80511.1 hypothetical protein DA094_02940 [Vibrio parahaemolyticus]
MQMDENNTNGAVKVNNVAANGGANLTAERLATASNEDFSRLNKDGIADIKESLLKRDGVAKEYQPTAIDIFNRTLRVNDPAINRELHDTMQDAEDMLEQQKNAKSGGGSGQSNPFATLGKLWDNFKGGTEKSKINDEIRKDNDLIRRVEESTNYGKDVYLDLTANRINLQNQSAALNKMLSEKKLTVDDLMIPETIGSNPDLAVKLREFNAARESFKSSCEAANDFATFKNEMGDSRSHIDTCNMDTINRINSEIELAKQLSMESHPETDAPNPFYDVFANAPQASVTNDGVLNLEENDTKENALLEILDDLLEKFNNMNPFQFISKRNASQSPSNVM